jgi:hypothetical protein
MFSGSCKHTSQTDGEHEFTNALISETSPYLLQHAHNPVNWMPWSPEALSLAKEEGKLVLVSIGYSSCHWCHVMEEESFEDPEVAALMNEHFISIKVDREERPDVDQVYMTALQLLKGSGGWPLNVITLPNGKPLYGGTYHTKDQWVKVLKEISKLYEDSPARAEEYADKVAKGIEAVNLIEIPGEQPVMDREVLQSTIEFWKAHWDLENGGNQGIQKFMLPGNLDFLLNYAILSGDARTKDFVKTTLDQMALGGIYDQIGGGFFRYSTDPYWHIPHFEKMLYDNAQLISLYSRAFTVFNDPLYREVAYGIATFLNQEMKHPGGAYYAALDADTEGVEGKYYLWESSELQELLGPGYVLFSEYFDIKPGKEAGDGMFIPDISVPDTVFMKAYGLSQDSLAGLKKRWRAALLENRQQRVAPRKDDKIITSWNALLIGGFADAYRAFGDSEFLESAVGIYRFLSEKNEKNGRLSHSYKENGRFIAGFLEDYAFLANAELQLYAITGEEKYLTGAEAHLQTVERQFSDEASGLYRFKADNELISKLIKTDDGVLPSPNAMMAQNLFLTGHINYEPARLEKARKMLGAVLPYFRQSPDIYTKWAGLLLQNVYPFYEVAIVGANADKLQLELGKTYLPNTVVLARSTPSEQPLFLNRFVEDNTFIYVCQNHSCKLPVSSVDEAVKQLSFR